MRYSWWCLLSIIGSGCGSNQFIEDLIGNMTLLEKLGQMVMISITSLIDPNTQLLDPDLLHHHVHNLHTGSFFNNPNFFTKLAPPTAQGWYNLTLTLQKEYLKTRLRIPMVYAANGLHGANFVRGAAIYPHQLGLSCSFNTSLVEDLFQITASDFRSIGIHWNFGPDLDIVIDKQWPRIYETFGEDPRLVSELGLASLRGLQGKPDQSELNNLNKVAATLKHFIGYSATRTGLDVDGAWITDRFINDIFRKPFEDAIKLGGAATIMESYSDIGGEPVIASQKYLKNLLRDQLQFNGILITDFNQTSFAVSKMKAFKNLQQALYKVTKLETIDIEMIEDNQFIITMLKDLIDQGKIHESVINDHVRRILQLKFKLGLFDNPSHENNPFFNEIGSQDSINKAIQATRESTVLLKNTNNLLPLPLNSNILVTGPVADSLSYLSGGWTLGWAGPHDESHFENQGITILQGLNKLSTGRVDYIPTVDINGNNINTLNDSNLSSYDAIIVCLGEDTYSEIDGNINDMSLPSGQLSLLDQLTKLDIPIILILSQGRPRVISPYHHKIDSILTSFLPGPYGGQGISETIFGINNPSGKLSITYSNKLSSTNLVYYRPVNTDFYADWEFGHGLSYTTFKYTDFIIDSSSFYSNMTSLSCSVTITNTGLRAGSESILIYISDLVRSIRPSVKRLQYFTKIYLHPHQSQTIYWEIYNSDLSFYPTTHHRSNNNIYPRPRIEPGTFEIKVANLTQQFQYIQIK